MPRFSNMEREKIREKLMQEGERLFTSFGLKKVSIDEIVQAAGIAKGSFYSFYTNKEHLYICLLYTSRTLRRVAPCGRHREIGILKP